MKGPFQIGSDVWPGLSKLIEEAGEVQQVAGKLIMTGGDPGHWDGSDLRERLTEELADLQAAIEFVSEHGHLDVDKLYERRADKLRLFRKWHREQQ